MILEKNITKKENTKETVKKLCEEKLGVSIFGSVWFLSKKPTKIKF